MRDLLQNIGIAIRSLARARGFTVTAVLALALGIGLATAVLTAANAFLLRPLPVRDQERLVVLWGAKTDGSLPNFPLLVKDFRAFAAQSRTLERVEGFGYFGSIPNAIRDGSSIYRLRRALVTGGFFDVLGARPVLGRALRQEDDVRGAPPVAVLSWDAWRGRFGGDPNIVGRQVVLHQGNYAYTIVGVMPRGLDYPRGTELWAPVLPQASPLGDEPAYAELDVVGRLRPGATPEGARAELSAYFARPGGPRWHRDVRGVVQTLREAILGDVLPAVLAFAAAAGLLLLITCTNVANLLLVRGLGRVREVAVRAALGASRGKIVAQLLIESIVLATAGGALGVGLAAVAVRVFVVLAPAGTPRLDELQLDGAAIAGAVMITTTVTLLFALAPAFVASRVSPQDALRSSTRQSGVSRRFRLAAEALVVGQVALALVVLSAAGLVTRSLLALQRVDMAFEPSHLAIAELSERSTVFEDYDKQVALIERLVSRVAALPGVEAASPVLITPFVGAGGFAGTPDAEGQAAEAAAAKPILNFEVVAPNYFTTLGIPILAGRAFTDADRKGTPPVVILSEHAASRYWPGANPLGRRVRVGARNAPLATVVGIVPETRYADLREARPSIYFPMHQGLFPVAPMTLAIRHRGNAAALTPALRRATEELHEGLAFLSMTPFDRLLDAPRAQPRLNAVLLSTFAIAAAVLAALGLYAVMATMVRQRTHELGVRAALGATSADLLRLVVGRGFMLASLGVAAGLAGALAANGLLRAMLFDVTPTDVPTLAGVVVGLLSVAGAASFVPARWSARVDPTTVLRSDG